MAKSDRILILISTFQAEGTPTLAFDLARIWLSAGYKVNVATFFPEPREMQPEFESLGIPLHCLNIRPKGAGKFLALPLKIIRLCREVRPGAILCFPFGWHGYLSWAAWLAGVRTVVAHAGNFPPTESKSSCRKMALAAWLAVPFGTRVACCSDYVRDGIAKHLRLPSRLLTTVYNGIDLDRFNSNSVLQNRANSLPYRCGMVARLESHKDHPSLIRAARLLKDRGVRITLDLVGDGSRRIELEALITQLGLEDTVRLLGTRRDIPELLHSWDLFVFSVTPSEGLGIALVEALAAGVPVIASNVGACREVLQPPGEDTLGALVQPDSAEALADSITAELINKSHKTGNAKRADESVRHRFGKETMAKSYLSLMALDG